ncbi:MAG: hypothetical protein JWO25_1657, partial [Alphaproteobacteria bacterium]|nr:hypothetical protein [Alphaproteobacteria bacterium]
MSSDDPVPALPIAFLEPRPGRRLACRRREGRGPTLIFLPG